MPSSLPALQRLKVFISYSRKDMAFADLLVTVLEQRGFDVLIDRRDLPALEDWERELLGFIRAADTVVFVVSPNSLRSQVCAWEVEQVRAHAKRLAPVVIANVDREPVPREIARINYIHFTDPRRSAENVELLVRALRTDHAWLKEHTRLGEIARRWVEKDRPGDALLRGLDLREAESWASRRPLDAPILTPQLVDYLDVCRREETARLIEERRRIAVTQRFQKRAAYGLGGVAVLILYLLVATLWQARESERREAIVLTSLAARASSEGDYEQAMRVALQALPTPDRVPLLSLGWSSPEIRAAEAKLAGAAQQSRLEREIWGDKFALSSPMVSPDGTSVYALSDGVRRYDLASGAELGRFGKDGDYLIEMAVSPDGKWLAVILADNGVAVIDSTSGEIKKRFADGGDPFRVSFSPDGRRVLTVSKSNSGTYLARVLELDSGRELIAIKAGAQGFHTAKFSPDGTRIVTSSYDRTARIFEAATGLELKVLQGHEHYLYDATFSGDGARIVTASADRSAIVWDAATGARLLTLRGHRTPVQSAIFHPVLNLVATSGEDGTARIWHGQTGVELLQLRGRSNSIALTYLAFAPDGRRLLASSGTIDVRVWNTDGLVARQVFSGHVGGVSTAAFSADGSRVLTASQDRTARLWDAATGKLIRELKGHTQAVTSAAYSPDERRVLTTSWYDGIGLWDADSGARILKVDIENCCSRGAFSPDGRRIVIAAHGRAEVRDSTTGALLHTLAGQAHWCLDARYSSDGRTIVTSWVVRGSRNGDVFDPDVRIFDAESGAQVRATPATARTSFSGVLDRSGTRLMTAADSTVEISPLDTLKPALSLAGHVARINSARFSADETRIVTASSDGTVRLWDVESGALVGILKGHDGDVTSAELNAEGTRALTASADGTARLWDVDWLVNLRGDALVDRVCREKLVGWERKFGYDDAQDPILKDLLNADPCARSRPLSFKFWTQPFADGWSELVSTLGYELALANVALLLCGAVGCAAIARQKGRSMLLWGALGAALLIVTLPLLLLLKRRPSSV